MDMFQKLLEAERLLPEMLRDGQEWNTLFITYHPPFVERLWRQWGDYRICLHTIHALEEDEKREPLFHPHPWPSAMRVHDSYEMLVGYSTTGERPPISHRFTLAPGSTYVMEDPNSWHSVQPPTKTSRSMMVIAPPFRKTASPLKERVELTEGVHDLKIALFQDLYPENPTQEFCCRAGYCHDDEH